MDIKNLKKYIKSDSFLGILIGIGIVICVLIIFRIGVEVGERRAFFACHYGNNFERNFKDPNMNFIKRKIPKDMQMPIGHGAVGEVLSINLPNIIVSGPDKFEKSILINENTEIRKFRENQKQEDLKIGDFITVFGIPNDQGQIEAKLIRISPPPQEKFINKEI